MPDIYSELNMEIRKCIDNDILCEIYQAQGWSRVEIHCPTDTTYVEVLQWVKTNAGHKWQGHYDAWVFESIVDATAFSLTWAT